MASRSWLIIIIILVAVSLAVHLWCDLSKFRGPLTLKWLESLTAERVLRGDPEGTWQAHGTPVV